MALTVPNVISGASLRVLVLSLLLLFLTLLAVVWRERGGARASAPVDAPVLAGDADAVPAATTPTPASRPSTSAAPLDLDPWLLVDPEAEIATAMATVRIYIYNLDGILPPHPFVGVDCLKTLNINYHMESMLPAALAAHARVVQDPAEADYFLVPHNGTCYGISHVRRTKEPNIWHAMHRMSELYLEPLMRTVIERFPYYNASSGRDHLYLFTFDRAAMICSPYVYNVTATGIRLQSFGALDDPVLPGNVQYARPSDIVIPEPVRLPLTPPSKVAAASERGMLALFVGTVLKDMRYGMGVRAALQETYANDTALGPAPDRVLIHNGRVGANYSAALGNATFGLCPGGWAPWSPRLYDALSQSAIPTILADKIVEPYESYLNWRAFTVKVAHAHVAELKDRLLALRSGPIAKAKQHALQRIAPYLYWTTTNSTWRTSVGLVMLTLCERAGKCAPVRRYTPPPIGNAEY